MKTLIMTLLFCASLNAQGWLEIPCQTGYVIDMAQTMKGASIKKRYSTGGEKYHAYEEQNVILGKHPSKTEIVIYFTVVGTAHYFIAKKLPKRYRIFFQLGSIAAQAVVIYRNHKVGIRIP